MNQSASPAPSYQNEFLLPHPFFNTLGEKLNRIFCQVKFATIYHVIESIRSKMQQIWLVVELTVFQQDHDIVSDLCRQLNTRPEKLLKLVSRQADQLAAAQKEIKRLQAEQLSFEAGQLSATAEPVGVMRLVAKLYPSRSLSELRGLFGQLPPLSMSR